MPFMFLSSKQEFAVNLKLKIISNHTRNLYNYLN
jgi:hypothetical protein